MNCHDCEGSGESNNPGQCCFFCNGSGTLCDRCGEPCAEAVESLCDRCQEEGS